VRVSSVTVLANSRCDDKTLVANIKTELTGWFETSVVGRRAANAIITELGQYY